MGTITVARLANIINLPVEELLEQLHSGGIAAPRASGSLSEREIAKLLKYVRHRNAQTSGQATHVLSTHITLAPKGDNRCRASQSVKLWALRRSVSKESRNVEYFGAVESIERTLYHIDGKQGDWVRYLNRYHPLHSIQEFSAILESVKRNKCVFFNNELGGGGDAVRQTTAAPFIFLDESGPFA
jgi:translation initiation factor IF-2-like protein